MTMQSPTSTGLFDSEQMRGVMSFNLRLEGDGGERAWELRRPLVSRIINEYRPAFVGTQEGKHGQLESLKAALPDYDYVGVSRRGNTEDEYCALFYDKTQAEVVRHGDFWLSGTPDIPASKLGESGHPRMATWAEFRVKGQDAPTYVFNTHVAEQPELSAAQSRILLQQAQNIAPPDAEIVITGDFNVNRTPDAMRPFTDAGFADALALSTHQSGPDYSFHGWRGTEAASTREAAEKSGKIYDWILYRNGRGKITEPLLATTITDHEGAVYPSDHFPVALTSLGRARAGVRNVSTSSAETLPDTPVNVSAQLHNGGASGIVPVTLSVNGEDERTEWHVLEAGQKKQVAFDKSFYTAGEQRMAINGHAATPVQVAHTPARLQSTDFSLPPYLSPGEEAELQFSLRNIGAEDGQTPLTLGIDGEELATQDVSVKAGALQDVTFRHRFTEAGAYTVTIGDREAEISVAERLPDTWRFAKGDGAGREAAGFDDADWQPVHLPAPWEKHSGYDEDHVFGWYRNEVFVPKEWEGRPLRVLLGTVDDVDESFFNGVKVGQNGRFPDDAEGYKSAALAVRAYTIPPEAVQYGAMNSIAIRAYDSLGDGGVTRGPLGILPLKAPEKAKWVDKVKESAASAAPAR